MLVYCSSLNRIINVRVAMRLALFLFQNGELAFVGCLFSNRQLDLQSRQGAHQVSIVKYEKGKCAKTVTPIPGTVTFEGAPFILKIFAVKADRKILLEPDLCLRRKKQFLSFARLPTGSSFSPFQNLPRFLLQLYQVFGGGGAGFGQCHYYSIVRLTSIAYQSHISLGQKPQTPLCPS